MSGFTKYRRLVRVGRSGKTCPYRMELPLRFSLKKGEQKITKHYVRDKCFFFSLN